jgi:hypothetical protein
VVIFPCSQEKEYVSKNA